MKKKKQKKNEETINLDNEIIIGLTPKKENIKSTQKKKVSKKKTQKKKTTDKNTTKKTKNTKQKPKAKNKKKKSIGGKIIKWTIILMLLVLCIVLFLLSSVFNVKTIIVENNNKLSKEEIISLSGVQINENMFKILNSKIREGLKTNPYIEDVKIGKDLQGIVKLDVLERKATYMLQIGDIYAYMNNQGYILEVSETQIDVPILSGFGTPQEEIKPGNRLNEDDLGKLDTVIKIMADCKNKEIDTLISAIDIANANDYKIIMALELKTVHFGNSSSINEKVLWIKDIIERKKGIEGDIFVKNPEKNAYFRAKV